MIRHASLSRLAARTLLPLSLGLLAPLCLGQEGAEPPGSTQEAMTEETALDQNALDQNAIDQIHDELRAVQAAMEQALNTRDLDAILAYVTDDVLFTTMNGDVVRGPEAIRAYFAKMMEGEERVVDAIQADFQPAALSILYGGDLAIAYGTTDDHYRLTSGATFDIQALWSCTLLRQSGGLRQDGGWKIASFHYSTNMFDNPVLSAQRRLLLGGAVVAAVVFGLLGFFLGRREGRKFSS